MKFISLTLASCIRSFRPDSVHSIATLASTMFVAFMAQTICTPQVIADQNSRPHIVLVMADDQGWGDMAYNGHPHLKTPVFDEMAAQGVRFDQFYAAAPVCSPTRASVMTGRTPNRSGVFSWGHSLRPQEITVAEALHSAGYVCGHFGKWHLGSVLPDAPTSPGAQGFDTWLSAPNFFEVDPWLSREGTAVQLRGESSELVVAAAVDFMKQNLDRQQPLLSVIWFGSPHSPHVGTPADLALYADQPPKQQHFLAEVTAMDRAVGQLRAALRELGIADNTLLWYCSDNGAIPQGSTGGLRARKGSIYDGGLRVPALLEWPHRFPTARRISVPASTVDIYPTLLEVAGVKLAHQPPLDGESLLSVITGEKQLRSRPLGFWDAGIAGFGTPSDAILQQVAQQQQSGEDITAKAAYGLPPAEFQWTPKFGTFPGHSAWRDGDWKLHRIERQGTDGIRYELYNLNADPQESHDLMVTQVERASQMQEELEAWLLSVTESLRGVDYRASGTE